VEDALSSADLCLVEWPEKAAALLPETVWNIYIEVLDEKTRRIFVKTVPDEA
jgi:tRNA threonylcarbamoyladenosine biosynthesis protein TsaE